jgi:hypothetical protein
VSRASFALLLASLAIACGGDSTRPIPVADVDLNRTTAQLAIGDSVLIVAITRDGDGNALTDRDVSWSSTNAGVASVSDVGWVKAISAGTATITATSETITAQVQVTVNPTPVVASVSPALLTPGITAILTGAGFSATPAQNSVTIDGVTAAVTAASTTQLTVTLGSLGQFPCRATRDATVSVTVAGISGSIAHPLQVATQQSLGAGESLTFATAAEARCNEFAQTGGRYFVAVHRPDNAIATTSSFQLKGEAATTASARVIPPVDLPRAALRASGSRGMLAPFAMVDAARAEDRAREHRAILEENLSLKGGRLDLMRQRADRTQDPSFNRGVVSFALATVGDTSDIRIPNRDLPAGTNTCTSAPLNVRARTVYSGTRAIILEDVASLLAGTIDSYYQALGQEFDNVMYPIITANFGDPLAYDAQTDDNGKLLMLFSHRVNDFGDVFGFVTSCDLLDTLIFPTAIASNQAEIFYAISPDETGTGFNNNSTFTADEWRRIIRGTLIHEAKHIAMIAERFANLNATTFEESWLEEGMAMHSEELYSRTITGATWKGNTPYGSSGAPNHLWCELRPSTCADRPFVMVSHFGFLHDYLTDIENRTILGGVPGNPNDGSFYGSSWAFVRWMLDAYATSEAAVLQALTVEPTLTGTANLSARIGVPFATMLPQFHYALRYDDVAGLTPTEPWQTIPSWNFPNLYAGLTTDFQLPADYLLDHPAQFGSFTVNVNTLRGGTAAHFEISGSQAAKQLVALQALNGGAPDPLLRMTVFRVQ